MDYSGVFPVTVKQSELVAAVLPVQEHWLPLSNLDLLLPPLDVGVFLCYRRNSSEQCMSNIVNVVKKALAQALVSFYPFAGEIVANRHGEPEILCNNRGVDFTYAYADVELKDLDLYHPDQSVHGKLAPVKMRGVLSVQLTELKCSGLVIGCTFDHRAADAHSANMFLSAWAELAQAKPVTRRPSFRRSLLNPRRPPLPHKSLDRLYAPLTSLPPPSPDNDNPSRLTSQIYHMKSESIDRLQSQATHNGTKRTKIEAFSAFLWKTIADGGNNPSKTIKLGVVVDGRRRIGTYTATSLDHYFGNVLSVPYVEARVGELQKTSLKEAADVVHACLAETATSEHFFGLIDWVEVHRPKPAVVRVYCKDENDEAAIVVSSGQRFPVRDLDFGWGGPAFGSYHFPWGGETGYVMPVPCASGNGDWVVYMHLMKKHLDLIEASASQVFRPFGSHCLGLEMN